MTAIRGPRGFGGGRRPEPGVGPAVEGLGEVAAGRSGRGGRVDEAAGGGFCGQDLDGRAAHADNKEHAPVGEVEAVAVAAPAVRQDDAVARLRLDLDGDEERRIRHLWGAIAIEPVADTKARK